MKQFHSFLSRPRTMALSLTLNAILGIGLVWTASRSEFRPVTPPAAAITPVAAAPAKSQSVTTKEQHDDKPRPFHWSQLDSPDFTIFVKNLRGVGCPEATLRDIVQGELREIYALKRHELEQRASGQPLTVTLNQQIEQISQEEAALLAALTQPPVSAQTTAQTSKNTDLGAQSPVGTNDSAHAMAAAEAVGMVPAAFLVGNDPAQKSTLTSLALVPTDPRLTPQTAQILGGIRDEFARTLDSVKADPATQAYRLGWASAKQASDQRFAALFGGDYYVRTQIEAAQAAAAK